MNRSFKFWFKYILTLVIMLGSIALLAFTTVKAPFDIILYLVAAGCPFMLWHFVADWKTEQYVADKAAGKFDDIVPDAPIVITKQEERRNGAILINVVVALIVTLIASFLIDGYWIHSIPDSFNTSSRHILEESQTEYSDAKIINGYNNEHDGKIILLVETEDGRHLLYFDRHKFTHRWSLHDSIAIEQDFTGPVSIGRGLQRKTMKIDDDRMQFMGPDVSFRNDELVMYCVIAVAVTAIETFLFCKFIYPKKKKRNHNIKQGGTPTKKFITFVVLLTFSAALLAGCAAGKADPVQEFKDAMAEFLSRDVISVEYTNWASLDGVNMEVQSTLRLWQSGEDWAQATPGPFETENWSLWLDGKHYQNEMDEAGNVVWTATGKDATRIEFWGKGIKDPNSDFKLVSAEENGGIKTIVLTLGEGETAGFTTYSPFTITAKLTDGKLVNVTQEYKMDVEAHDGFEPMTIFTKDVVEISQLSDQEIESVIQEKRDLIF